MEHYAILGLQVGATRADITKAWHKIALVHHPDKKDWDKHPNSRTIYTNAKAAHAFLSDDGKRKLYDEKKAIDDAKQRLDTTKGEEDDAAVKRIRAADAKFLEKMRRQGKWHAMNR